MPLSEDEQRILRQIEEQLQRDPTFGREMHHHRASSRRSVVVTAIAAVLCLALSVVLLGVSPYLSFVAFLGAVAAVCSPSATCAASARPGSTTSARRVRSRLGGSSGRNRPNN